MFAESHCHHMGMLMSLCGDQISLTDFALGLAVMDIIRACLPLHDAYEELHSQNMVAVEWLMLDSLLFGPLLLTGPLFTLAAVDEVAPTLALLLALLFALLLLLLLILLLLF